ncbi:MAG TPA: MarR family transcriptional regulator [Candidatus Fusicatenibacter merdavium]|uniref:MarR family transcriptional regulator n=1 Tax=Candidatus Fusicatenibacter merdavium TaxID=2838600 RepID=A0A9D2BH46_9FIRM|nr:MarR family transcriptional regulator [Candidatus Fusicatenibacter merdavium]
MKKENKKKMDRDLRKEQYESSDRTGRLIINFRNINHTMRALYEGKGSQKRILIVLLETGEITQRVLTERLGIQPGSASEVLAKLEHAGLIVRRPSDEDRRTTNVSLTEIGRE